MMKRLVTAMIMMGITMMMGLYTTMIMMSITTMKMGLSTAMIMTGITIMKMGLITVMNISSRVVRLVVGARFSASIAAFLHGADSQ
jgi:hypothetical protein